MTKAELNKISKELAGHPTIEIRGTRRYDGANVACDDYALDCVDALSGIPFVIYSREDWQERQARTGEDVLYA